MTLLSDKLKAAGIDTFESKFAKLAFEALQHHPDSVIDAWRYLGVTFGHEYMRERLKDMRGAAPEKEKHSPRTPLSHPPIVTPTRKPISPQQKAAIDKIINKAVDIVKFGCNTSDGRDWARVHPYEFAAMKRDNALVTAVEGQLGTLSNHQFQQELGELIKPEVFSKLRKEAKV